MWASESVEGQGQSSCGQWEWDSDPLSYGARGCVIKTLVLYLRISPILIH